MKPRKNTFLVILLGLLLFAFAAALAQTPSQGDQKSKTETCCAMDSCCCNNGSCPMKKEGATGADAKEGCCSGDSCEMKDKDGMKNHAEDKGCCACCGESCDMSKHDAKHDATMKHDHKSHKGDCCKMKQKDAKDKTMQ